jgi:hypothetical protein
MVGAGLPRPGLVGRDATSKKEEKNVLEVV